MDPIPVFDHLHVTRDGTTTVLRFDHGKANEVGSSVLDELDRLADLLAGDATCRALLTTSTRFSRRGTPIFVSGADVAERVGWSDARVLAHVDRQRGLLDRFRHLPLLHVVVVHGVAFGWGTEFALTGDVRVATPTARFALPETGLGIVPGAGGTAHLAAEIGLSAALRLGMTGEEVGADEALSLGLVSEVSSDLDAAHARARALCEAVATRSPTAVAAYKAAVRDGVGEPAHARTARERDAYATCVQHGDAAVGRARFGADSPTPPWPSRIP